MISKGGANSLETTHKKYNIKQYTVRSLLNMNMANRVNDKA